MNANDAKFIKFYDALDNKMILLLLSDVREYYHYFKDTDYKGIDDFIEFHKISKKYKAYIEKEPEVNTTMTNQELYDRNKNLLNNQALLKIAGHEYLVEFDSEFFKLAAVAAINEAAITNLEEFNKFHIIRMKEIFSVKRFFLVTGFNEGKPIEPYMIESLKVPTIPECDNHHRFVEAIDRSQVIENLKQHMRLETEV